MPTPAAIVLLLQAPGSTATSSGAPAVIAVIGHLTGLEDRVNFLTIIV